MSVTEWTNRWNTDCINVFGNIINAERFDGNSTIRTFSLEGLAQVNEDFKYMWSRIYNATSGYKLTEPGQPGYHQFQPVLLDACRQNPGACESIQAYSCAILTRADIASSSSYVSLCGCYAPSIVDDYGTSYAAVTTECDPLCSQQVSIRKVNKVSSSPSFGRSPVCNASICVIDAVTIGASQSTTGGAQFSQVCPSCVQGSEEGCKCIVNFTSGNIMSVVGGQGSLTDAVTFRQYCPNATCLVVNSTTGSMSEVPCGNFLRGDPLTDPAYAAIKKPVLPIPIPVWAIALVIFVVFLLAFVALRYQAKRILVYSDSGYKPPTTGALRSDGRLKSSLDYRL